MIWPQYDGLEKLYQKYKKRGLDILGIPSNQFLAQEPGSNEEISSFCRLNYGVTFPPFFKIDVRGNQMDPLFQYLSDSAPFRGFEVSKESGGKIRAVVEKYYPENLVGNGIIWNCTKFLVGRDGHVVKRFEPTQTPEELKPAMEQPFHETLKIK